jgi:hypothetical protein
MNKSKYLTFAALFGSINAAPIVGGFNNDMMCKDVKTMLDCSEILEAMFGTKMAADSAYTANAEEAECFAILIGSVDPPLFDTINVGTSEDPYPYSLESEVAGTYSQSDVEDFC